MTAEVGLPFTAPERVANTRRALATAEFVRTTAPFNVFDALDRSLFSAYWAEGRDIGSADVLDSLVESAGGDAAAAPAPGQGGAVQPALRASHEAGLDAGAPRTPAGVH